jgi:hypothetical protein
MDAMFFSVSRHSHQISNSNFTFSSSFASGDTLKVILEAKRGSLHFGFHVIIIEHYLKITKSFKAYLTLGCNHSYCFTVNLTFLIRKI